MVVLELTLTITPGRGRKSWTDTVMALMPGHRDGSQLRHRYAKVRDNLFTFLNRPDITRQQRQRTRTSPTATYRKVTGGFRSEWGDNLLAAVQSVIVIAKRAGIDAYQVIKATLRGQSVLAPG